MALASKILHLPDYCNLFKELLVEELIYYESPFEFHYGKCSVIGKLCRRNELCYLQNISLVCLDKECCLQTGAVDILLLPTSYQSNKTDKSSFRNLVDGSFYEVHGETVFSLASDITSPVKTTEAMIRSLRMKNLIIIENSEMNILEIKDIPEDSCTFCETNVEADIEKFKQHYRPAIQVHTMNEIDQAAELIHCNLQLRLLRNKRRNINY